MGDAVRDDARLTASRPGQNEQWSVDVSYGLALLRSPDVAIKPVTYGVDATCQIFLGSGPAAAGLGVACSATS